MVDDGRDHGDDRRSGDHEDSRHYEQRRDPQSWHPTNGWLLRLAGGVTALVVILAFAMNLLGLFGRFTGNKTDISDIRAEIATMKTAKTAIDALTATNTLAIAANTATNASQARDLVEFKATLASLMFINCGIYQKIYAGAPTISECVQRQGSP